MNLRNFALFESSLPDDRVEESGDIAVPAGRNVLESLSQRFEERGFKTSIVSPHSFYGWSFEARIANRKFWFLIQGGLPWLLIVQDRRSFLRRVLEGTSSFNEALSVSDAALRALAHVSGIKWFTQAEYEARGRGIAARRKKEPNQTSEPTAPSGRGSS